LIAGYSNCYKKIVNPKQVRAIRKRLGLTQQELADMIAASQVTVARWETGVNEPNGAHLKALQELVKRAKKNTKRRS
jgi:DNA-binding transcriptional regulator YiaG